MQISELRKLNIGASAGDKAAIHDFFSGLNKPSGAVQMMDIASIRDFPGHPYSVPDNDDMERLISSIKEAGQVNEPIHIWRASTAQYNSLAVAANLPLTDKECEFVILSGHRRRHACLRLGWEQIPAILGDYDIDSAVITMVDANLHRESILPSEKAKALKMKMDALKHQGKKLDGQADSTCRQIGDKSKKTVAKVGKDAGESSRQIHRFLRLNYLNPELLQLIDDKKLAINTGVTISYLSREAQAKIYTSITELGRTPDLKGAKKLRKAAEEGTITKASMKAIILDSSVDTNGKKEQSRKLDIHSEIEKDKPGDEWVEITIEELPEPEPVEETEEDAVRDACRVLIKYFEHYPKETADALNDHLKHIRLLMMI